MQKLTNYVVLDIGGTLIKLCFISKNNKTSIPHNQSLTKVTLQDISIFFNVFKTIEECFQFVQIYFQCNQQYNTIALTGGGCYKYYEEFKLLGKNIIQVKQFTSLLEGFTFFQENLFEQFILNTFKKGQSNNTKIQIVPFTKIKCPLLIVNVGSGVSILKISKINEKFICDRVGGTSLGGGYFMGLAKLLTAETNFQQLLQLARKGNNKNIDYTPQDFTQLPNDLSSASVLISLGKLSKDSKKEDIVRSLFNMVAFNIAQIALMYSDIVHVQDVIFTGFFCRNNSFMLDCFAQAFSFFQNTPKQQLKRIYSLKHDGYLGTIGALHSLLKQNVKQI